MIALVMALTVLLVFAFLRIAYYKREIEHADRQIKALEVNRESWVSDGIDGQLEATRYRNAEVWRADSFNASIGMEVLSGTDVKSPRVTLVQGLTGIQVHVYAGKEVSYLNGSFEGLWLTRKEPSWVPKPSMVKP